MTPSFCSAVLALLLFCGAVPAATVLLVPTNAVWRYLDVGVNQGTAWRAPLFSDESWSSGAAELGYGDSDEATIISYGPNSSAKYITTYFRQAFPVTNASAFTNLSLRLIRDDGAVVYLNGTEVFRSNMPTGTVNYLTAASTAASDDGNTYQLANLPTFLLVEGTNTLAVEIHQNVGTSSDLSFALELVGAKVEQSMVLNAPAQGATQTVTSPTMNVTVSDATGDNLTVTFHGRPAGPLPGPDFTIVALPDTQYYVSSKNGGLPAMFYSQVDWILTNRAARNIAFVTQLGDCVENGDAVLAEWQVATNALYRIEDPVLSLLPEGVPYGVAVGNHDQSPLGNPDGATRYYNEFFGEAHFAGRSYYGGHYGTNNDNHFELFSASGLDFIAVHLEFNTNGTSDGVLQWANNLLQTYGNRRALVVSHWMLNTGNPAAFSPQGQLIYNTLRTNSNLFLMLGGHVTDEGQRSDTFNGNTVHTLLSDYQGRANGGNGLLRMMEFSPSNNVLRVQTFSPYVNQFETDANSQFTLSYNLQPAGSAFSVIASQTSVPSGSAATVVWPALAANSSYEWYVVVSDGVNSTTSPTWRFTTGDGAPLPPTVTLTAPANNAMFSAPAEIPISASAADADGTVSRVEFFANDGKIAEVTAGPFAGTWSAVPEGSYALTAVATDNSGMMSTSAVVNVSVITGPLPNVAPTVTLTAPANAAQFTAPANVVVSSLASDADGSVTKVEFFNGAAKIGEALTAPYSITWGQVAAGNYTLRAIATDNVGAQGTSAPVSISVLTPNETAVLTRGPYLQLGTPSSMVVRWRTDLATETRLRYGTNSGSLNLLFSASASVTDHVAQVSGLAPATRYFYEMGTALGWYQPNANDFFVTAPAPGTPQPTRVWMLGDSGTANGDAANVRNAYLNYTGTRRTDLLLMLGDNAYNNGTDAEYGRAVFDFYPSVLQNTVLWPTIGNHDTAQSANPPATLPYFTMFSLPTNAEAGGLASGTEKYYSFDHGNVHFICLDSMTSVRTTGAPMLTWLEADLGSTTQQWVIAFWHHPPYTKGSHNSDVETELVQMRQYVLPILEAAGVDLVFAGHSHSYERSFLLDGHYGLSSTISQSMKKNAGSGREDSPDGAYTKPAGLSANQGAVYTVAGASGKLEGGTLNHPAMFLSVNVLGSVVLDVLSNRVEVLYLGTNGTAIDHFTVIKDVPPPPVPAAPHGLVATALSASEIELRWNDNSADEQSFAIERSLDGINFALLSSVGANVTNGVDAGLAAATIYHYRVRAVNASGASAYSESASATTTGSMLPPAPTGLSATPADRAVTLLWDATPNTLSYNLRRAEKSGGPYGQIAYGLATASFTDNNVENGRTYYYVVSAVGEAGEGPNSAPASATPNLPLPWAPLNLAATDGDALVTLSWESSLHAATYNVKRATTSGGPYAAVVTDVSTTNYLDTTVFNGTTYFYVVSPVNASGEGSNSVEVVANPLARPATPENFDAVPGDSVVFLRWDAVANATAYRVQRAIEGGPFETLAMVATTTFTDMSVTNEVSYTYLVSALNGAVESVSTYDISVYPTLALPLAPAALSALAGDAQVALVWPAVAKADRYSVRRATVSGGPYAIVSDALVTTSFTDPTVANGTTYFYVVLAVNAAGPGGPSPEATATPVAVPVVPTALSAGAVSTSQVDLAWTDNSAFEAAVEVEQSLDGGVWTLVAMLPANAIAVSVTSLAPATTYYFRVRAVNASGASAYSDPASATTFDVPPSAPESLSAMAVSTSQVNLAWLDRSSNETGFVVESSLDGITFTIVATPGANTTMASATGLAANTFYLFRVRALNAFGSSANATTSATTLVLPPAPTGVVATPSNAQVTVSWNEVVGATSYQVKRSLASGGPFTLLATPATNVFANTGLTNGVTYFYVVSVVSAAGEGPDSATVSATPLAPPGTPSGLTVSAVSSSQLRLAWIDNATNEAGFRIERATSSAGPFSEIASVGVNVRSFTDSGLLANKTYYYRVRAYHSAGLSAYAKTASGKTKR